MQHCGLPAFFSYLKLAWFKKKSSIALPPLCLLICKTVFSWVLVAGPVVLWGLTILDFRPCRTALFLVQYSEQFFKLSPFSPPPSFYWPPFFLISCSYSISAPVCFITSIHNFFAWTFQLPSHSVHPPLWHSLFWHSVSCVPLSPELMTELSLSSRCQYECEEDRRKKKTRHRGSELPVRRLMSLQTAECWHCRHFAQKTL